MVGSGPCSRGGLPLVVSACSRRGPFPPTVAGVDLPSTWHRPKWSRTMSRHALLAVLFCLSPAAQAEEWKSAPCPIPTRWAKEVDPKKGPPLPEYPRPQFVRKEWQNLNGLWQYAEAKAD